VFPLPRCAGGSKTLASSFSNVLSRLFPVINGRRGGGGKTLDVRTVEVA
jgi:hypothetical protein